MAGIMALASACATVILKSGAIAKRVVIIWNLCGRSGIRYLFNRSFDDFGFDAALRFRPRMKRAQIRSITLEIVNMRTMNRAQLDKLISDHFMYEVIDDVEGVLRTFTDDVC